MFDDPLPDIVLLTGENTPPYYYGTHYSSAMIVASYLIRMEPFSQYFLKLQVSVYVRIAGSGPRSV